MDTIQIEKLMRTNILTKKKFLGVFAIDKLPMKKLKRPCSIICNTDPSFKSGKHWIAFFLPKFGKIEYFDSFGLRPMNQEIYKFISMNGNEYKYNSKQIQSNKSKTCGKFCIMFLLFRSKNLKYIDFINLFINDKKYNEKYINKIFIKTFPYN